jgi:hypothetical protein
MEENKVENHNLAGWKRLILILVPFILLGFAVAFMVMGILAWGPDFTRNHGDSYLTLSLICTILLVIGIAMQFVWPKAINKGKRIVVVGLVFNIILTFGGITVTGVGYAINNAKYAISEKSYTEMGEVVRKGLSYKPNETDKISTGSSYTVSEFILGFNTLLEENSGKRAVDHTGSYSMTAVEYLASTKESFYSSHGYGTYAYSTPSSGTSYTQYLYSLYLGDEQVMKDFIAKFGLAEFSEYGEDYKFVHAPKWFETDYVLPVNRFDKSKTVAAHFDYEAYVVNQYEYVNKSTSTKIDISVTAEAYTVGFDLNAKSVRVYCQHMYRHQVEYIS